MGYMEKYFDRLIDRSIVTVCDLYLYIVIFLVCGWTGPVLRT